MEVLNEILLQRNTFSVVVTLHGFGHFLTELARLCYHLNSQAATKGTCIFTIWLCKCLAPFICCHTVAAKDADSSGISLCFSNT